MWCMCYGITYTSCILFCISISYPISYGEFSVCLWCNWRYICVERVNTQLIPIIGKNKGHIILCNLAKKKFLLKINNIDPW